MKDRATLGVAVLTFVVLCALAPSGNFATAKEPTPWRTLAQGTPATQSRLSGVIKQLQTGTPDYSQMEPMLAAAVQNQLPMVAARLQQLGALGSLTFVGQQNGADVYNVQFANGGAAWGIALSPAGKIAVLFFQ